nr:uncharacterized protein At3g49720-like [Ipomoea batatas]
MHGDLTCTTGVSRTLAYLSKAYGDSMHRVLHVGPESCSVVSKLLKEEETEARDGAISRMPMSTVKALCTGGKLPAQTIAALSKHMEPADTIIDGGFQPKIYYHPRRRGLQAASPRSPPQLLSSAAATSGMRTQSAASPRSPPRACCILAWVFPMANSPLLVSLFCCSTPSIASPSGKPHWLDCMVFDFFVLLSIWSWSSTGFASDTVDSGWGFASDAVVSGWGLGSVLERGKFPLVVESIFHHFVSLSTQASNNGYVGTSIICLNRLANSRW